jgi:hypothetical protein
VVGVSKEELARIVVRQAFKDPLLFRELSKRGFELERVPEAYVEYLVRRGDPVMMEVVEVARYILAVARYLDYHHRSGLPLRRRHLEVIAKRLAEIGARPERGKWCLKLYESGWAKSEGLPYMARMDALPKWATRVYLRYSESPTCIELPVVD